MSHDKRGPMAAHKICIAYLIQGEQERPETSQEVLKAKEKSDVTAYNTNIQQQLSLIHI